MAYFFSSFSIFISVLFNTWLVSLNLIIPDYVYIQLGVRYHRDLIIADGQKVSPTNNYLSKKKLIMQLV